MFIRKSTNNDIEKIMNIYTYARKFMAEHGNPNQWGPTNWPPLELIKQDILVEKSYVCVDENDNILGTFFYDFGEDIEDTYLVIENGNWLSHPDNTNDKAYGVVHRIAVAPNTKNVGSFCISWALDQCRDLRIDTHSDNIIMQNLLTKLGFVKCGIIHVVEDNYPRYAYEKQLTV